MTQDDMSDRLAVVTEQRDRAEYRAQEAERRLAACREALARAVKGGDLTQPIRDFLAGKQA